MTNESVILETWMASENHDVSHGKINYVQYFADTFLGIRFYVSSVKTNFT